MKSGRLLLAALALVVAAPSTHAQPDVPRLVADTPPKLLGAELWQGARLGMTIEDVAKRFPKATPASGEALFNGAKVGLTQPVELGGAPATVRFFFSLDGLVAIIVDVPDVAAGRTEANLVKARAIRDQLSTEYGQPRDCSEQDRIAAFTCDWPRGAVKTVLSYRDIGGAQPRLSVSFRRLDDKKLWAPGPVRRLKAR